jgi:hypothetical protein
LECLSPGLSDREFLEDVGANVAFILLLGIQMAAAIVLLPRMVEVLKEGLLPLVQEIRAFLARRFPERKIYLGLDASLALGHPAVLILGLLMVPLTHSFPLRDINKTDSFNWAQFLNKYFYCLLDQNLFIYIFCR